MTLRAEMSVAIWCLLGALMMLLAFQQGCGFPAALAKSHEGLKEMSQQVEPPLAAECLKRAKRCKAEGAASATECAPLTECRKWKARYVGGTKSVHRGLGACNGVYSDMKKAGVFDD